MSDMTDLEGIRRQLAATIQAHWKLFLAQGVLMMGLGFFVLEADGHRYIYHDGDQGAAVAVSFGLSSLVFAASIPGKLFNGYMMEIVGRRWTITGSFVLAIPGLIMMMTAHQMGSASTIARSSSPRSTSGATARTTSTATPATARR